MSEETIAILGLGKVGTAVGYLLRKAGYTISAVASRTATSINQGLPYTGGNPYTNYSDAASQAECIFITTSDDVISSVCEKITAEGSIKSGKKVIHMSGVGGLNLLESARNAGAKTASIHPLQSFADIDSAIKNIPGSTFGITSEEEIKEWSVEIVKVFGGTPFFVSDSDKPLYHAAACFASNYLTTLIHIVEDIYKSLGLNREEAIRAVWPLIIGTVRNIESSGTVKALTGPISRGDVGTIQKHLHALQYKLPDYLDLYKLLGIITTDLGLEKQTLSNDQSRCIKKLLGGG
jgi:predicted short-subunit dehydrogenase-like oxidoreductase (DUF2520 family)